VLMRSGSFRAVYIDAVGNTEFDPVSPPTGDPTLNLCPFLWQDINGDQRPDGLFFLDSPGPQMVFRNSLFRRPAAGGGFTLATPNLNEVIDPQTNLSTVKEVIAGATYYGDTLSDSDTSNNALHGRLDLLIDRALAGAATHFDIVVWHQADPLNSPYLDRVPVFNARYTIPAGASPFGVHFQLLPPGIASYYWPQHDHYYLDMHFVDVPHSKVVYGETDGLTLYPFHPSEDEAEEAQLYELTFYYLNHRDPLPGQTPTLIPIGYPAPVDPPGGIEPSHTDLGEIRTRIVLPIVGTGNVPL